MNWKRGVARIYVVLWILFAMFGAFSAYQQSKAIQEPRTFLKQYMERYRLKTLSDVDQHLGSFAAVDTFAAPLHESGITSIFRRERERVYDVIWSWNFKHPVLAHLKVWSIWLLIFGVTPAIVLAGLAWVVRGFEK